MFHEVRVEVRHASERKGMEYANEGKVSEVILTVVRGRVQLPDRYVKVRSRFQE